MEYPRTASGNGKMDSNEEAATADDTQNVTFDLITQVRYAAALGWVMTELLGRCYLIETWYHKPPDPPDFSAYPVILSPVLDPVERICAVTGRILFLAKQLDVDGPYSGDDNTNSYGNEHKKWWWRVLGQESDNEYKSSYTDSLDCKVELLRRHLLPKSTTRKIIGNMSRIQKQNNASHEMENCEMENCMCCKSCKDIREAVNELLFEWDESIQFTLQSRPPAVYNAYTVGRGFATLRWYIGVGLANAEKQNQQGASGTQQQSQPAASATSQQKQQESLFGWYIRWCTGIGKAEKGKEPSGNPRGGKLVTPEALNKLRDHLHSMSCYLPPFVPEALDYSLDKWGQAIIDNIGDLNIAIKKDQNEKIAKNPAQNQDDKKARNVKEKGYERMRIELIKQSIIWHDLLTGERDPTTYVKPQAITREYVRRLFLFSIPFIVLGLILAFVIAFVIVHIQDFLLPSTIAKAPSNTPQAMTDDAITNAITTIITAAATIPVIRTLWIWASKTTTSFTTTFMAKKGDAIYGEVSTSGKDALHLLWQRSQQVAINKASYRSPKPSLFYRIFPFLLHASKKDGDGDDGD